MRKLGTYQSIISGDFCYIRLSWNVKKKQVKFTKVKVDLNSID